MAKLIPCDGRPHPLSSSMTESSSGVRESTNRQGAIETVQVSAQNDLARQINEAKCEGGCLKSDATINLGRTTCDCHRLWYTLWIFVTCTATVTADTTITCSPQG